jgi:pyruvate-ferredoxin/flavodoxin oxidoreductase
LEHYLLVQRNEKDVIDKKIKVYAIDAQKVAENSGMGRRINTVMQVVFLSDFGVLQKNSYRCYKRNQLLKLMVKKVTKWLP